MRRARVSSRTPEVAARKPLIQRIQSLVGPRRVLKVLGAYPPYLGAGVSVADVEGNVDAITVQLNLTPLNRNYVGTQFGGSLYAMCDPWFMFLLMWKLGEPYVVWDKWATIRFLKPGKTKVRARFHIPDARVEEIRAELAKVGKIEAKFETEIVDAHGVVIAQVEKGVHAHDPRMKPKKV